MNIILEILCTFATFVLYAILDIVGEQKKQLEQNGDKLKAERYLILFVFIQTILNLFCIFGMYKMLKIIF